MPGETCRVPLNAVNPFWDGEMSLDATERYGSCFLLYKEVDHRSPERNRECRIKTRRFGLMLFV